jgi:AraC-like DNA-binding protein
MGFEVVIMDAVHPTATGAHKCTKSTWSSLLAHTRYRQRTHAGGVNSWSFSYANPRLHTRSWVGCGLELGVQLRGSWHGHTRFGGRRVYRAGTIMRASVGEAYAIGYDAREGDGLQIGFVLPDALLREGEDELRFAADSGLKDRELSQLAEWLYEQPDQASPSVADVVRAYVRRHASVVRVTPLVVAKRELERHFAFDLGMHHVTELAGIAPEAFARSLKAAYGVTPARYRIMIRVNYASRLLWSRPDMSVAAIAEQCGFPNRSYFHRSFQVAFGMTASQARTRFGVSGLSGRSLGAFGRARESTTR